MKTVQLKIFKDDSIRSIQEKFSGIFPYLWISIFKHIDGNNRLGGQNILFCEDVRMGDIHLGFRDGTIMVSDSMTVSELEKAFFDKLGLLVQISRKSEMSGQETSELDNSLLNQANRSEREVLPPHVKIVYFRDVPFGC
jgi:hypothetical protein